jgi:hypothetical protein
LGADPEALAGVGDLRDVFPVFAEVGTFGDTAGDGPAFRGVWWRGVVQSDGLRADGDTGAWKGAGGRGV